MFVLHNVNILYALSTQTSRENEFPKKKPLIELQ